MSVPSHPGFPLTRHAEARCHQRGIKPHLIRFVLDNFDCDRAAGAGMAALSISKARIDTLLDEGTPIALLEQASRTVLLVSDDGAIVTAINRPTWHNRRWTGTRRQPLPRWRWARRKNSR